MRILVDNRILIVESFCCFLKFHYFQPSLIHKSGASRLGAI